MDKQEYNPFSGEAMTISIGEDTYRVRGTFVGTETLSEILRRRVLREYQEAENGEAAK